MQEGYFNILTAVGNSTIAVKIILLILVILSIYSWGTFFNKFKTIRQYRNQLNKLYKVIKNPSFDYNKAVSHILVQEKYSDILTFLEKNKDYLVTREGGINPIIIDTIHNDLYSVNTPLDKSLTSMATIGNSSPFIGLLGTVMGIINSFESIGLNSSTNLAVIAPGVAESLYTTALGLFVAIPAVFAYNYFVTKIENFKDRQEIFIQDLIFFVIKNNPASSKANTSNNQEQSKDYSKEVSLKVEEETDNPKGN